jgi:hypothetical protein
MSREQHQAKTGSERIPLQMTTAVVADSRLLRNLSADSTLRLREEDKVQQLRNVSVVDTM